MEKPPTVETLGMYTSTHCPAEKLNPDLTFSSDTWRRKAFTLGVSGTIRTILAVASIFEESGTRTEQTKHD